MRFILIILQVFCALFFLSTAYSNEIIPAPEADPHYTKVGFFDIHVCNWPKRKPFFMALFSTYKFNDIEKIEVFSPDNVMIGEIGKNRYRLVKQKGKPEKRVFIKQFEIPENSGNGWYRSVITTRSGKKYESRDYIILARMEIPQALRPAPNELARKIPEKFVWNPVPGAKNYMVFIKDVWEEQTIYTSKILDKPELVIPKGLLKHGGVYSWRVHARDVNETALLGDFNHGSLNEPIEFTIE